MSSEVKFTKNHIIEIFVSAGYKFVQEHPKDRLLFYCENDERDIQFWFYQRKKKQENFGTNIYRAIDLITTIQRHNGIVKGKSEIRDQIKSALGLTSLTNF